MALSRDDILSAIDLELQEISVPEWGGAVFMRNMSGNERDLMEAKFRLAGDDANAYTGVRAFVLALVLCDEQRFRLFTDEEHVTALGEKNARVLDRLFETALTMNDIGDDAVEAAKKNSASGLSGVSGSSLP